MPRICKHVKSTEDDITRGNETHINWINDRSIQNAVVQFKKFANLQPHGTQRIKLNGNECLA